MYQVSRNKEAKMSETKQCSRCKADLDLSNFYSNTGSPDGLYSRCKKCSREIAALRYKKNPLPRNLAIQRYLSEEKHRLKRRRYMRDYMRKKRGEIEAGNNSGCTGPGC